VYLERLRVVWRLRETSAVEGPEFWCGNREVKNQNEDRNNVRCARQAKKGRGERLQIVGIINGTGRVGGAIRPVKMEMIG